MTANPHTTTDATPNSDRTDDYRADGGTSDVVHYPSGETLPVVDGPTGERERYWDPNGEAVPLVDTSDRYRDVSLSENFRVGEFAASGGREFDRARIDPELVRCLERLRTAVNERVGGPGSDVGVVVTSGYRSWDYNVEIYRDREGDPTHSEHCSGRAADVRLTDGDLTSCEIARIALENGPPCDTRVGVHKHSQNTHVDVKPRHLDSWEGDGIWHYWDDGEPAPPGYDAVVQARAELDSTYDC